MTTFVWVAGSALVIMIAIVMFWLLRREDDEPKPPALPPTALPLQFLGRVVYGTAGHDHLRLSLDRRTFQSASFVEITERLNRLTQARLPVVIAVTGAHESKEYAKVAGMLAVTIARAGCSVVMVDTDLRSTAIEEVFGIEDAVGLTDVLAGVHPLDDALLSWGRELIEVLPNGMMPPDPSELLESEQLRAFIAELRGRFDVVILHSSPIVGSDDCSQIVALSDVVVLVTHDEQVALEDLAQAVDSLAAGRTAPLAYLTV
ncbi:MAG: CpsD/CapB family tyrosine-protein kinase [Candidatus Nanopelagicales bacterium]